MLTAIHLCAKNDRNGNPRRCYVVLNEHGRVGVVDEGYKGISGLYAKYPELKGFYPESFSTTPEQYQELTK